HVLRHRPRHRPGRVAPRRGVPRTAAAAPARSVAADSRARPGPLIRIAGPPFGETEAAVSGRPTIFPRPGNPWRGLHNPVTLPYRLWRTAAVRRGRRQGAP